MAKIYFRTIFYAPHELPFIKMSLMECYDYIDNFIICEFNRTHVGEPREFTFLKYQNDIPERLRDKIVYIPGDISIEAPQARDGDGQRMHANETVMWDYFSHKINLHDDDIVIAADADEVIYGHMYPRILERLAAGQRALLLPMHTFFYRMNYLWEENVFHAITACKVSYYRQRPEPHNWRYEGVKFPFIAACHFSWQLTIDQMIMKLKTYAHKDIYGHFAQRDILEAAVRDKKYPFEPDRPFTIHELDPDWDRAYYPRSFYFFRKDFEHLLPEKPIEACN